eukprot:2092705-Pleurochrysis_carterae.AAC.1
MSQLQSRSKTTLALAAHPIAVRLRTNERAPQKSPRRAKERLARRVTLLRARRTRDDMIHRGGWEGPPERV